jgi:hypothetical protein
MTVQRGFLITITSGLAFAVGGALVGYLLGVLAPDYYRTVFGVPPEAPYDPVQVGVGLGLTQGATAGLLVGVVIVVSVALYHSRIDQRMLVSRQGE